MDSTNASRTLHAATCLIALSLLAVVQGHANAGTDSQTYALPNTTMDYALREALAPADVQAKLRQLRNLLAERKKTFSVGYTTALDVPLEVLAATRIPRELPSDIRSAFRVSEQLLEIDRASFNAFRRLNPRLAEALSPACSPSAKEWDWRKRDKVTSVKAQICGTCWDFTAMGVFESSYVIRNAAKVDASEQYILNCANAGSCSGGWWMPVFDFMISVGTAKESEVSFTGNDALACPPNVNTPYRASAWGFVDAPQWDKVPAIRSTKQALCEHGPLAVAVEATPLFQAYTNGIFDETNQAFPWINHGVVLIGWSDEKGAWLIKNSWGTGWGEAAGFGSERGYMWIRYGSNNIGIAAAWIDAARQFYKLPTSWFKVLEGEKLVPRPLGDPDPGSLQIR